jgi:quercetin dioxygenase-like cupin family protein
MRSIRFAKHLAKKKMRAWSLLATCVSTGSCLSLIVAKRASNLLKLASLSHATIRARRNPLNHRTAVLFFAIAAVTALSPVAESPGQTDQITIQPPHPDMPDATHGKLGITHKRLLRSDLAEITGQEVIVWDTEYAPRAINPRHYHPAAITFHVVSGTGIWQEEGKAPVTLKAGDSLFTPAGTTHTHWNPSYTESLRFLEFIVGEKDKARPEPLPQSN